MSPRHHPDDVSLLAYLTDSLQPGARLVIGVHLAHCAHCRGGLRFLDLLGAAVVSEPEPATPDPAALALALLAIETSGGEIAQAPSRTAGEIVSGILHEAWRPFVPGVELAAVTGRFDDDETVCMLRGKAGAPVPTHGHEQVERFVVLQGGFGLDQTVYAAGDYVEADAEVTHTPFIPASADCLCLFALKGGLVFSEPVAGAPG